MATSKEGDVFTLVVAKTSDYINGRDTFLCYLPDDGVHAFQSDIVSFSFSGHHICAEVAYTVPVASMQGLDWTGLTRVTDMNPVKVERVYSMRKVDWK